MPQFDEDEMTGDEIYIGKEPDGMITDIEDMDEWESLARTKLSFDYWTEQPTSKASSKVKEHGDYDNTSLDPSVYATKIHRDYLAHVMRWGWIIRQIRRRAGLNKELQIIEVGCGRETSLFKALASGTSPALPKRMTLVDINKLKESKVKWTDFRSNFDFVTRWPELQAEGLVYDMAVNTEVIEHITTPLGLAMLNGVYQLLAPGGDFFISTPVYNGHRAVNHIREYTVLELQEMLELSGFEVVKRYGTFASWNDIKRGVRSDESLNEDQKQWFLEKYNEVADFYGHDVMACYAAPLYPDFSRNNVWHCRKPV